MKLADTLYNADGTPVTSTTSGITQLTGNVTAGPGSGSQVATIPVGTVTEAMQVLANNTTQNVSISKHGYAPILPNDATKFLDGTGAYSTPSGAGNVTTSVTLTSHALVLGGGSSAIGVLGSLGTSHQLLHGNASGDPSYSAVDLAADVTGILPTTNLTAPVKTKQIQFNIDNSGSVLTTGIFADNFVDYACTITAVTILADQSGSAAFDIWVTTSFSTIPTIANTIVASAPPTLSSAAGSQDTTLAGWTTAVAKGSRFRITLTSVTTITRAQVTLTVAL